MYMKRKKNDSTMRVISLVLMVAMGVIALVIGYATWKGSQFDIRSKASNTERVVREWTFDAGFEGWKSMDFFSTKIEKQSVVLTLPKSLTYTTKDKVCKNGTCNVKTVRHEYHPAFILPQVTKQSVIQFRSPSNTVVLNLAVYSELTGMTERAGTLPLDVVYSIVGDRALHTVTVQVTADGRMGEYRVMLPENLSLKTFDVFKLSFDTMRKSFGARIVIDNIRFIETVPESGCVYRTTKCLVAPCPQVLDCPVPTGKAYLGPPEQSN